MLDNYTESIVAGRSNSWHQRVADTRSWCTRNGYPDFVLQSHCPYIVDRTIYQIAMCQVPWGRGNGVTTHAYFNLIHGNNPLPPQEPVGRTVRIKQPVSAIDPLIKKHSLFLNFNNNGFNDVLKQWLANRFPNKSRWEK